MILALHFTQGDFLILNGEIANKKRVVSRYSFFVMDKQIEKYEQEIFWYGWYSRYGR